MQAAVIRPITKVDYTVILPFPIIRFKSTLGNKLVPTYKPKTFRTNLSINAKTVGPAVVETTVEQKGNIPTIGTINMKRDNFKGKQTSNCDTKV